MEQNKGTLFSRILTKTKNTTTETLVNTSNSVKIRITLLTLTVLIISFLFTFDFTEEQETPKFFEARPGDKWSEQTVIAEFSFPIYKDRHQYQKEVKNAKENTPLEFTVNKRARTTVLAKLDTFKNKIIYLGDDAPKYLNENFNNNTISFLIKNKKEERVKILKNMIQKLKYYVSTEYKKNIIDTNLQFISSRVISVYIPPNNEVLLKKETLLDRNEFLARVKSNLLPQLPNNQRQLAYQLLFRTFTPNLEYSEVFTKEAMDLAVKNVAEREGFVRKGEIIIKKGDIVTEEVAKKIDAYNRYRYNTRTGQVSVWMILGNLGQTIVIFSILIVYLILIRKRIYRDNIQLGILCRVLILVSLISWLTMQIRTPLPIEYFIFLPGLSMLVAIVFDSRTAFYVTVTMALFVAGVRGNDYDTSLAMMIAGILAGYSVRDIQSRTQLFRSMLFIFIGFSVTIIAFSLERSYGLVPTLTKLFVAGLNSAISPLVTFGLLFLIEKTTNITTDLKLEEYNNLNHPLLVQLSEKAPGSYQHTLSLSIMAEKCATEINANSLLCKVGAYFHDIGKMVRPEYFAENQMDMVNKHDMLSPKKSAEAIKTHVTQGIRLAKEYKLPQRIIDFIPMHHGTTLIKHFYAKALEEAGENGVVDEKDFRYPGPKPNSKETAIVMICDSAEAISRLSGKTKEEMEKIIESTIQSRFLDGQFDECDITLKDLEIVKATCVKHLQGTSHQRVAYKEIPENNRDKNGEEGPKE